jgi:transcriptional regulator with XRE-family HTH domain
MTSQHAARAYHDSRRVRPLLRTTLGEVLRRARLEQGRTLADVARSAKVSMQYLSEIERGLKEASSEVLAAICDALETDLPDVLAEVGRELAGAPGQPATVVRLGIGQQQGFAARRPASLGGGDVVCLLAA